MSGATVYAYVENNPLSNIDPYGQFLWPWERPVSVTGGTAAQRKQVQEIVQRILNTKRGAQLEQQIRGSWYWHGDPKTIHLNKNGVAGDYADAPGPDIYVDPCSHPWIHTNKGSRQASTQRIVAHELGHAVTGAGRGELTTGAMDNINQNENPISRELGEPYSRTQYSW